MGASGRLRHTNEFYECLRCTQFLESAHPLLREWFARLRDRWNDVHISCSWRGEQEQNDAVKSGASRTPWPNSRHNAMDEHGQPCSQALDLFILEEGIAKFPWKRYAEINEYNQTAGEEILWGGEFRGLIDGPHFELYKTAVARYREEAKSAGAGPGV